MLKHWRKRNFPISTKLSSGPLSTYHAGSCHKCLILENFVPKLTMPKEVPLNYTFFLFNQVAGETTINAREVFSLLVKCLARIPSLLPTGKRYSFELSLL